MEIYNLRNRFIGAVKEGFRFTIIQKSTVFCPVRTFAHLKTPGELKILFKLPTYFLLFFLSLSFIILKLKLSRLEWQSLDGYDFIHASNIQNILFHFSFETINIQSIPFLYD